MVPSFVVDPSTKSFLCGNVLGATLSTRTAKIGLMNELHCRSVALLGGSATAALRQQYPPASCRRQYLLVPRLKYRLSAIVETPVNQANCLDDASGQRETTTVSDLADGRVTETPSDARLDLGAHPGEATARRQAADGPGSSNPPATRELMQRSLSSPPDMTRSIGFRPAVSLDLAPLVHAATLLADTQPFRAQSSP